MAKCNQTATDINETVFLGEWAGSTEPRVTRGSTTHMKDTQTRVDGDRKGRHLLKQVLSKVRCVT